MKRIYKEIIKNMIKLNKELKDELAEDKKLSHLSDNEVVEDVFEIDDCLDRIEDLIEDNN